MVLYGKVTRLIMFEKPPNSSIILSLAYREFLNGGGKHSVFMTQWVEIYPPPRLPPPIQYFLHSPLTYHLTLLNLSITPSLTYHLPPHQTTIYALPNLSLTPSSPYHLRLF